MRLDTHKTFWSQYAYQVAHEFGHVHCGFQPGPTHNQWFEESVCETASLFCLRAMAKSWRTKPPYPHWASYAPSLGKYADDVIAKRTYKDEFTSKGLARFYRDHEAEFRANATERELNGAVALALLPYLEEKPSRWAAFRWLNATPRPDDEPSQPTCGAGRRTHRPNTGRPSGACGNSSGSESLGCPPTAPALT